MSFEWDFPKFDRDMDRLEALIPEGLVEGMAQANAQFENYYKPRRLQRRGEDSTGPRTRGLLESFKTKVRRQGRVVEGWRGFEGGAKLQLVASVLEKGATIRAKRKGRPLRFKLYRKFSRRAWEFPKAEQWIATYGPVVVPPYLHFEEDFTKRAPADFRIIGREITHLLQREGFA